MLRVSKLTVSPKLAFRQPRMLPSTQRFNTQPSLYIDTHTHIDMILKKFQVPLTDFEKFASKNFPSNWGGCIHISCTLQTIQAGLSLISDNTNVWGAFGVHPHNADTYSDAGEEKIVKALAHPKTVALGEIGLDYYRNLSPIDVQHKVFQRQLELAITHKKPLVIHTREADEDTYKIMKEIVPVDWPVHVHCFTSSANLAEKMLAHWNKLYFGFTGVITFSSAGDIQQVVEQVPLNRILLETDSPFMTPIPHRGKTCHSGYIPHIAQKISTIKQIPIDEVYRTCRENTKAVYGI